jgi:beta-lactamase regulating signal transducer with metallopeptidase domain
VELFPLQFHLSSSSAAQLLIASVWQGVAIAAITWLLLKLLPGMNAARRFRVWMAAFLLATLLPFASLVSWTFPGSTSISTSSHLAEAATQGRDSLITLGIHWSWALLSLWLGLSIISLVRFGIGLFGIRQLLRSADPVDLSSLLQEYPLLGKRNGVRILAADTLSAPVATGFLRPVIVLPRHLLNQLTQEEMRQVLLHEYEHLARRDDWTTLVIRALRCLLPFSPALFYIERQLGRERELACDDAVLHQEMSPRGYALCLTRMAEMSMHRREISLVPSLLGESSQLTARVSHILGPQSKAQEVAYLPFAASLTSMALTASALLYCPNLISFRALPVPASEAALAKPADVKPVLIKANAAIPATPHHVANTHKAAHSSAARSHEPIPVQELPTPDEAQTMKMLVLWQAPANSTHQTVLLFVETTSRTAHSITIERQIFQI